MKKRVLLPMLLAAASLTTLPSVMAEVVITLADGHVIRVSQVDHIAVNHDGSGLFVVTYADGTSESFSISSISDMRFDEQTFTEDPLPSTEPNVISITWNGSEAPTICCSAEGVSIATEGGNVVVTNTNTDTEYTYLLSGSSNNGSFTLEADYKSTIKLDNLSLHSQLQEALNIKCGKRIALIVGDGTSNSLADATTDNGQKGAIYCKGHLELEGDGTLSLTGNVKHALASKEYVQLKKKFTGNLNILSAESDGIHAGQYFLMNGGNVSISSTKGDGIQAEITTNADDEMNGQLTIKGGKLNINVSADDAAALKSDKLLTIEDGTLQLTTSGAGGKAIKSKTAVSVSGGNLDITQSGKPYLEAGELSYVGAIKADELIDITGGNFNITNSALGGRGFSSDTDINISGTTNVTLTLTGNGGTAADAIVASGSQAGSSSDTFTAKGITSDQNVNLTSGTINITMSGTGGKGVKADKDIVVGDKTTGEGPMLSVVTKGASYSGGTSSGTTGGTTGGWGGGWGGRPGGNGGGPGGGSTGSSSKAMKATGNYHQYGGSLYINTATSGAEGIESKTRSASSMNFAGGSIYLYCYDDCINSAGAINFCGAHVMAISYGNDAIDSNYGQAGALAVSDGTVIAFSTRGGAEMGFDCDNNSYIKFTGGTLVAGGGQQGGGSSASLGSGSVHYKVWSASISYSANNYYSVTQGTTGVFTFCLPVGVNSSYNFYACSDFKSSTNHSLLRNTTAPTGGTPVFFRTSADDLIGKPLFWRPTDVTSGTSVTSFSPS